MICCIYWNSSLGRSLIGVSMVESMFVDNVTKTQKIRPASVWRILATGFDQVTANPVLIVPPLVLDLFLWLGPRLTSTSLFERASVAWQDLVINAIALDPRMFDEFQVELVLEFLQEFIARINFFWGLSSFPMAIPSSIVGMLPLIPGRMPLNNPLGAPSRLELPANGALVVLVLIGLLILGLTAGTAYHRWIAGRVFNEEAILEPGPAMGRIFLVSGLVFMGAIIALTGLSLVGGLLTMFLGAAGSSLAVLFTFSLVMGVGIYFFFTPHGILAKRLRLLPAMLESFNVVRWNMTGMLGFVILAGTIMYFTNWVWMLPDDQSWSTLLGLIGHAFVSATLLSSSYVFYKDRLTWLDKIRAMIQA